jgi:hypothetical protein
VTCCSPSANPRVSTPVDRQNMVWNI